MPAQPLLLLDSIFKCNRGSCLEADIFSHLRLNPHVLRSFEFALADGAVDCSSSYPSSASWASRFHSLNRLEPDKRPDLLLFDVKSSCVEDLGRQSLIATIAQTERVAFFICVSASNAAWVDIVPNIGQKEAALKVAFAGNRKASSKVVRRVQSRLPPEYFDTLDPSRAPYRIPIGLLSTVIDQIRECARTGATYTNPWTGVSFPEWKPVTTRERRWLRPDDDTAHFTAYEQAMMILRYAKHTGRVVFEFVHLQPCLADFTMDGYLVQAKVDTEARDLENLTQVTVSRDRQFYFNAWDQFDFLLYQFESRSEPRRRLCFFVPEKELPDSLYVTMARRESFAGLAAFRLDMDVEGNWIESIRQIISQNPHPRRGGVRPSRPLDAESMVDSEGDGNASDVQRESGDDSEGVESEEEPDAQASTGLRRGDRLAWLTAMTRFHVSFFEAIMKQCARRGSGVVIALARDHVLGDFAFARYRWSKEDQQTFDLYGRPPRVVHSMPHTMPVLFLTVFSRHRESWFLGPNISNTAFARLDSSDLPRLLIWDLGGPDYNEPLNPVVIPSTDLSPDAGQRKSLCDISGSRAPKTPNVSGVLNTSRYAAEYGVNTGHNSYGQEYGCAIWRLLDRFTLPFSFEHPVGIIRDPSTFRHPLRLAHQRLKNDNDLRRAA